jgi:hypothetical protein
MALSCRDLEITEAHQIQLFMASLGQPLCIDATLRKPATMYEAIMYVRAYEQRSTVTPPTRSSGRTSSKPPWPSGHMSPSTSAAGSSSLVASINQSSVEKFTPTEIADRRLKGICFKCDDKFVASHREACKRLFSIELLDDDEDDGEPTISLAALTSIHPRIGRTMHVSIAIGSTLLCALLDSGSTHNFIDTIAAERACVIFLGDVGLQVVMTNGDHISNPRCSSLLFNIASEQFDIYCYGLTLGSFDMVLGVQWLESLCLVF